jgi:hypothetical protein
MWKYKVVASVMERLKCDPVRSILVTKKPYPANITKKTGKVKSMLKTAAIQALAYTQHLKDPFAAKPLRARKATSNRAMAIRMKLPAASCGVFWRRRINE